MKKTTLELGDLAKDEVSGFAGVITGITTFLHGCSRVGVTPRELKEGQPVQTNWFDAPQLVIIEKGVVPTTKPNKLKARLALKEREGRTGGPMDSVPTRNAPGSRSTSG